MLRLDYCSTHKMVYIVHVNPFDFASCPEGVKRCILTLS